MIKNKKKIKKEDGLIKEIDSQTAVEAELISDKPIVKIKKTDKNIIKAVGFINKFTYNYITLKKVLHKH